MTYISLHFTFRVFVLNVRRSPSLSSTLRSLALFDY